MKTHQTIVIKTLHVTGRLWSGHKCKHDYPLHVIGQPELEGVEPRNLAEAKRIAGDFAELESARLVTVTREVTETTCSRKIAA